MRSSHSSGAKKPTQTPTAPVCTGYHYDPAGSLSWLSVMDLRTCHRDSYHKSENYSDQEYYEHPFDTHFSLLSSLSRVTLEFIAQSEDEIL